MKNNYSISKVGIDILVAKGFWRQNCIFHHIVHWHLALLSPSIKLNLRKNTPLLLRK